MKALNQKHPGFILVTTIWFLAIALLAASTFALWTNRSLELVTFQSNETRALIDIHSTNATLRYLLSTQPMNAGGLITNPEVLEKMSSMQSFIDGMDGGGMAIDGSEILLDGRTYRGLGKVRFSIEDESGFININSYNGNLLKRLVQNLGISKRESEALFDKLQDYTDKDEFHRLQGAETFHYEQVGKPPPSNKPLTGPFELNNVMDWSSVIDQHPEIMFALGVSPTSSVNLNSANALVLRALSDTIDEDTVNIIIVERDIKPFASLFEASQRTKVSLTQLFELLSIVPSQTMRISMWHDGAKIKRQQTITITPSSIDGKPWKNMSSVSFVLSEEQINSAVNHVQFGFLHTKE